MDKQSVWSAFWSIIVVFITDMIIVCSLFINFNYWPWVIIAISILDGLLVGLVIFGIFRHKKVKDKGKEATTLSRKMFNIISGLLASLFIFLFDPIFSIFVLVAMDFAFGMHEVVYAGLKTKMWYTDAFNALGRQTEEYKPYYPSFMALLSSTLVLLLITFLLYNFQSLYLGMEFKWIVFYIYTTTVLIWGVGDSAAYLVGSNYGKHKLPWNKKKSLEGMLANSAVGILIAFIMMGIGYYMWGIISLFNYVFISIFIGFCGGFYESLNLPVDDNLSTPLLTGLTLTLLLNFLLNL